MEADLDPKVEVELKAIEVVVNALELLDAKARVRVIQYVMSRLRDEPR